MRVRVRIRSRAAALGSIAAVALILAAPAASAATLFFEDFDGYTYFPTQIPSNDYVNVGLPLQSEGADEKWYGIRLQTASSGSSIDGDLAVQKIGGGTNLTPVGRVEDDAGFAFNINTIGYTSPTLEFDWRTFKIEDSTDRLRAGYFVGNIPAFASSDYYNAVGTIYDWSAWTPLLSGSQSNAFTHQSYALPSNQASVWVVFWLDNGEGDYGKVDNVSVTATAAPEPSTLALVALAGALIVARRRLSL